VFALLVDQVQATSAIDSFIWHQTAAVAEFPLMLQCFLLDFDVRFISVFILIFIWVSHLEGNDFQLMLQL